MSVGSPVALSDNPDFNRWLEENYPVVIEEYSFHPGDVLYKMGYDWYLEALERFITDPEIKRKRIFRKFPTIISYYFQQAIDSYANGSYEVDSISTCLEVTINFIYGLVVAEARHRRLDLSSLGIQWETYWSNELLRRLLIIENILDYVTKSGINFFCSRIMTLNTIADLKVLNRQLKQIETSTSQESYAADLESLQNMLIQLIRLEEVTVFRHKESRAALFPNCEILNGYPRELGNKIITLEKENYFEIVDDFDDNVIFAQVMGEAFCLAPFIHFAQETESNHSSLCFLTAVVGGAYQFDGITLSFDDGVSLSNSENPKRKELVEILKSRFSLEELRTLCFNLEVEYDDLPADGKENKARELVTHFLRREDVSNLMNEMAEMRPDIVLPKVVQNLYSTQIRLNTSDQYRPQLRVFFQTENRLRQLVEQGHYE